MAQPAHSVAKALPDDDADWSVFWRAGTLP